MNDFAAHREILLKMFRRYKIMLQVAGYKPENRQDTSPQHALALCMVAQDNVYVLSIDKLNRWLGFVQACCIMQRLTTVEAERGISRQFFDEVEIG